ncbi:MAG: ABC transporter substrate-binding protein [Oscillospiraceae bacterium]|nr:ABC transporter substrate-binding protein [Oscillospiraceae bacterium]
MKKTITVIAALCLMLAIIAGCANGDTTPDAGNGTTGGVVHVHNWGEFIDMDVLDMFYEEYGIRVIYSTFESNERLYSLMRMGGASIDVIIPSDYMIGRLIEEDMLYELDFSNIPNFDLIDPRFKNLAFDPDNRFAVPYKVGTVGLIYNSAMITEPVTSWGALFDPQFARQILMFDNPRDAFGVALLYLGYSLNTTNETEIREAFDLLVQQRDILQAYVMDQIFEKLISGEAWIGPYYSPDFLTMYAYNPDLRIAHPVEGANFFVDAMAVPRGAQNRENAELFINFMSRTDIALMNMSWSYYASANYEAAAIFAEQLSPMERDVVFATPEVYANTEVFLHLPQHILDLYDELWIELRS